MNTQYKSREWNTPYGPFTGMILMTHKEAIELATIAQGSFGFINHNRMRCVYSSDYHRIFKAT